ncbi:MAG: hypothetical protein M3Q99_07105 [Acidobacteriota bacterium]|nr:hypothetical protein [Acidobacteriota bacterium]
MQKMTLYFYAAALAGILMLVTFTYSVILVPVWNWVGTIPAAVSKTTSGWFSAKPATNPPAKNQPPNSYRTDAPVMTSQEKPPKPVNCALVIKQIKSGKVVTLPPECEQTYEAVRREESDRRQAQREASQREQQRQRETQKRNDALIRFGTDLGKKIFKRNK